ncbi:MAG: alpha/beta fold hydrolase [Spirochaetota bacterium]
MRIKRRKLLLLLATASSIYFSICYFLSSKLITFPRRALEVDRVRLGIKNLQQYGIGKTEDVSIQQANLALKGWYFKPRNAKKCAILYHHGYTGTRYGAMKYYPLFRSLRCSALFIDARNHGESEGHFNTFGYHEKKDTLAWVDWLQQKAKLSEKKIALVGESFGAATILQAAGYSQKKFWFILADSPYKSFKSITSEQAVKQYGTITDFFTFFAYEIAGFRAKFDPDDVSPSGYAPRIQTPCMLVHSLQDPYTPAYHSKAIYARLAKPKKHRLFFSDWQAGHGRSVNTNFAAYQKQVRDFLQKINKK